MTEIGTLSNGDVPPTKLLCFLKCFGEATGFIVNGKVLSNELSNLPFIPTVAGDVTLRVQKCLESVGNIENCDDMGVVANCLSEFFKQ